MVECEASGDGDGLDGQGEDVQCGGADVISDGGGRDFPAHGPAHAAGEGEGGHDEAEKRGHTDASIMGRLAVGRVEHCGWGVFR